jgi:hypothetical protein
MILQYSPGWTENYEKPQSGMEVLNKIHRREK